MAIQYTSNYDETLGFSDVCSVIHLTTNNAVEITIPGGVEKRYSALFGYADDKQVVVKKNGTASIPAANTAVWEQYVDANPCKRFVVGGDKLSLITPDSMAVVTISLREIPA